MKRVEITATTREMVDWATLTGASSLANTIKVLMTWAEEGEPLASQSSSVRRPHTGFCEESTYATVAVRAQEARLSIGDYLREVVRRRIMEE